MSGSVLVTGASGGIGSAVARRLAAERAETSGLTTGPTDTATTGTPPAATTPTTEKET